MTINIVNSLMTKMWNLPHESLEQLNGPTVEWEDTQSQQRKRNMVLKECKFPNTRIATNMIQHYHR